jgi:hypothetical protein
MPRTGAGPDGINSLVLIVLLTSVATLGAGVAFWRKAKSTV